MLSLLLFSLLSLVHCALAVSDPPVLLVAGDSWGAFGWQDLQTVLTEHGSNLTVRSYAIGGTTTTFWARVPNFLVDAVDENPTTKYIWLSIGGNDVIDFMGPCTASQPIDECIEEILPPTLANTRAFLDPLFAKYPDIQVIQFGYDIVNFEMNALCKALGLEILRGCADLPSCVNPQMVKIQSLYVDNVTQSYPNHFALNLLGSLQAALDVPHASLGHPNLDEWSPESLMMANCIHPTTGANGGFEIIFNNLWDLFFK